MTPTTVPTPTQYASIRPRSACFGRARPRSAIQRPKKATPPMAPRMIDMNPSVTEYGDFSNG